MIKIVHLNFITFTVQAELLCLVNFSYDKVNCTAEMYALVYKYISLIEVFINIGALFAVSCLGAAPIAHFTTVRRGLAKLVVPLV